MESNAVRFINAYNNIDQTLRSVYNYRRNITFSDMIRRTVSINSVVRKYEDKLIDYARLRNAIIHNSNEEMIIAEPHDDVVADIEHIADLVSCPPLAFDKVATKNVLFLDSKVSIKEAVETVYKSGFKTIPICENETIAGVLTPSRIVDIMGAMIEKNIDINNFIETTPISKVMSELDIDRVFTIRSIKITVQEALDLFYHNRKLLAIILTKNGNNLERPMGILTVANIIDLNKIVEDYEIELKE